MGPKFVAPDIRIQAWAKPMVDGSRGVVVMNRSPQGQGMNLTWEMLQLKPDQMVAVRDLWQRKDLGTARGAFNVTVPPRDVAALRVRPLQ